MNNKTHILGIAGSLRAGSFNKALLKAAVDLAPADVEIEVYERLAEIPPFNQDSEQDLPDVVVEFKDKIRKADAILFVTPEYNYSLPGVLKNAIDWASRPYGDSAWAGKPAGIMSASGGNVGGARAQYHLRQVMVFLDMHPLNKPEVIVSDVTNKVDVQGHVIDDHTSDKIKEMLNALVEWTNQLKK